MWISFILKFLPLKCLFGKQNVDFIYFKIFAFKGPVLKKKNVDLIYFKTLLLKGLF